MLELIKELCALSGISGRENAVRDFIIEKIKGCAEYSIDPLGNLIVFKKGRKPAKNKVMLDAHMDEVGMMITGITSDGFLKFTKVGGINSKVIIGRSVKVGENAILCNVIADKNASVDDGVVLKGTEERYCFIDKNQVL